MKSLIKLVLIILLIQVSHYRINAQTTSEKTTNKDSINLIADGYFVVFHDAQGSKLDTAKSTFDKNIFSVSYHVAKLADTTNWPYFVGFFYLEDKVLWKDLTSLKVTYKSDQPLHVGLVQPVLLDFGESYRITLPVSLQWKTVKLDLKNFKQPQWSKHKTIPLDLSNIQGLEIVPETDRVKSAISGNFKLKQVKAYGISNEKKDTINAPIIYYSISNDELFLSVKKEGHYEIEIQNTAGEIVASIRDTNLKVGYNKVKLPAKINNGIYNISIKNNTDSLKRMGVVGNTPTYFRR